MSELVTRQDRGGLAILSLNRPETLNALSPALFVELRSHIDAIAADVDKIGVVVLRGKDDPFPRGTISRRFKLGNVRRAPIFRRRR